MTTSIEPMLRELAQGQHGLFTTQQALSAGWSRFTLVGAVKDGTLLHPARGLYAVAHLVDVASPMGWHADLAFGASLLWDDALLTSVTAVIAHGMPVWGTVLTRAHVLRPIDRSLGLTSFRVRQWRGQPAVDSPLGPAVDLSHALAQHAVDHGTVQGVVSADRALHDGLVTPAALLEAASILAPWRHGSRAMAMTAFADGRRESVGESRCAVTLTMAGFTLDPQVEIRDASGHLVGRVDFIVRGTNVIVEFDGKVKFESGNPEALWAEKKREDALRRLGYVVVRIIWADLEQPGAAVAKVRTALAAA